RPAVISPARWLIAIALLGAAFALVLAILLNPIAVTPIAPPQGKPQLTILVDRSASMAVTDQSGGRSRFQTAAEIATQVEHDVRQTFAVELRTFADRMTSVSAAQLSTLPAEGQVSDLATPIRESLNGAHDPGQTLLVLSDGIHNAAGGVSQVREAVKT